MAAIRIDFVQRQPRLKRRHHAVVRVFLGHMFMQTEPFLLHLVEMQKVIYRRSKPFSGGLPRRGAG